MRTAINVLATLGKHGIGFRFNLPKLKMVGKQHRFDKGRNLSSVPPQLVRSPGYVVFKMTSPGAGLWPSKTKHGGPSAGTILSAYDVPQLGVDKTRKFRTKTP